MGQIVPKFRYQTTDRRVVTQNTEELMPTVAEAKGHSSPHFLVPQDILNPVRIRYLFRGKYYLLSTDGASEMLVPDTKSQGIINTIMKNYSENSECRTIKHGL
jgi:hypothetical protein